MSGNFAPKKKSNTAPDEKDRWGTTWECFADACALYGNRFKWDVCAEAVTSKCWAGFFGPDSGLDKDALSAIWPMHWWCNPPFSQKMQFIQHARKTQENGHQGMMLLPYEPASVWWRQLLGEDVIVYEPAGRYNFYEVDGVTKKTGVNFPSAFILFPAHNLGGQSIRVPFNKGVGKHLLIDGVVP